MTYDSSIYTCTVLYDRTVNYVCFKELGTGFLCTFMFYCCYYFQNMPQWYMLLYLTNWYLVTIYTCTCIRPVKYPKAESLRLHGHHLGRKILLILFNDIVHIYWIITLSWRTCNILSEKCIKQKESTFLYKYSSIFSD